MNDARTWEIPAGLPDKMVIGGEHLEAESGGWVETLDPATGKVFARFPAAGASDVDKAVAVANGTPYGLVAGVYTQDLTRALGFARDVEAGQVFINQYFAGGVATPFGGTRNSGFGREKGLAALASYYQVKCVTARI